LKILRFTIIMILLTGILSCSNRINISEIKIALANDFFPFAYTENDTLKGLEIELLNLLEKNLRSTISISTYSFSQLLEILYDKDYDFAIGGITITEPRRDVFDFSIPYYNATQTFLTLENSSIVIDSLFASTRHRIGVRNNSSSIYFLENTLLKDRSLPVNNLRRYNSLTAMFNALENNEIALVLLEKSIAELISDEYGFKIVYSVDSEENYALFFNKNSTKINTINRALERVLNSEEWIRSKKSYLLTID